MLTATLHAAVEPFVSVFTVPLMGLDSVMKEPVSDGHSNPFFLQPEEAAITQTVAAPPTLTPLPYPRSSNLKLNLPSVHTRRVSRADRVSGLIVVFWFQ